jgi:hypothetical protein
LADQAKQYFRQAADIKGGIASLKPEEKEQAIAFKGALDASDKLKAIEANTKSTADKIDKISFSNQ